MDKTKATLDLSKKGLKKIYKEEDAQNIRVLLLDDNELQKIDNIDSYLRIEKLSISKNQLLRMYGVCRLHCLRELNLSYNGIITIEGLKELVQLIHLNLEGNSIKTIEHLNANTKLEYLNLSDNNIGSISDISFLKCLKELYLHGNRITHLKQCDKYLPPSLEVVTLAKNNIADLNEICTLSHLCNLHTISINDNPCVQKTGRSDCFDHRPFVLNWCMSVKVIDGFLVDPIESLKAEWLYSQGKGRQFRVGDQEALTKYLNSVCPLLGKALENENDRKLRLILSKAQQHQRQLQEEISENSNNSGNDSPLQGRKKPASRIQSPRFSRLGGRQGSPDAMSNSYHGNVSSSSMVPGDTLGNTNSLFQMTTSLIENIRSDPVMTQNLGGTISCGAVNDAKNISNSQESILRATDQQIITALGDGPLTAASKMVPVPESLMSPDCCPASVGQTVAVSSTSIQNQDIKHCLSKMTSNSYLKRNGKSPIVSPRKYTNNLNNMPLKSCISDCQQKNIANSSSNKRRLVSNFVELTTSGGSDVPSSDDESDCVNVDKLKTIRHKAAQKNQQNKGNLDLSLKNINKEIESAVLIQKVWRGYQARKNVICITEKLLKKRTQEYIEKLSKDVEMTKAQLENERKIQQLQMHAISALWKKVSSMQSATIHKSPNKDSISTYEMSNDCSKTVGLNNDSTAVVNDLTKTCSVLTNQIQQLQGSMRDILNYIAVFFNLPRENIEKILTDSYDKKISAATQTEIVAVQTPQLENFAVFPFKIRPSSLPLDITGDGSQQKISPTLENGNKSYESSKELAEDCSYSQLDKKNDCKQNEEGKSVIENIVHSNPNENI